jgi:hypothetical protein
MFPSLVQESRPAALSRRSLFILPKSFATRLHAHLHPDRRALRSLAFAALSALIAPASFTEIPAGTNGQNPLKSMSLEQLGNLEVTTVSKEPEAVWKTPAAIFVITQEDIQRSGATNIPEALRLAPGVEVARITSGEYAIGIRGFNSRLSRSVLVLIDGRTVYTTFTAGTYWETQDTLLQDIDRIEVIRGPGGTIWGPNAVNGVINIITKNTKDTQGPLGTAGGGNVEQEFADARYGSGNGKGFNYRVYVKGFGWASAIPFRWLQLRQLAHRPGWIPDGLECGSSRRIPAPRRSVRPGSWREGNAHNLYPARQHHRQRRALLFTEETSSGTGEECRARAKTLSSMLTMTTRLATS